MKQGWEVNKLGEVCEKITRGISPKYIEDHGVIVLNQKCIRGHKINFEPSRKHDVVNKNVSADKYIRIGDVLVNSTGEGTLGRVAQVRDLPNERVTVDSHVSIVRPLKDKFFLNFFGWAMIFIENKIEESGAGASGQTELARTVLENNFTLAYPKSIHEQQRIVAILDEAFAAIDKAKANAEQNLKNAKELFDCFLNSILYDRRYKVTTVGEVCFKVEYGSSTKSTTEGELPVLRMGNIQNGRFTWESLVYSNNVEDNKKYLLKYNDVLFNRTNSPALVGKTAIYKSELPAIFAGYLIRLHRKEELLDADYLNYYLNSKIANEYGKTVVISSVNQANINGTKLKTYPIPLPTLQEQQAIVQKLDALSLETKKLEAIYKQKIDDLEELKKSVLQKAFAGELKSNIITI
jgi:type I restriction enzyme S subunit